MHSSTILTQLEFGGSLFPSSGGFEAKQGISYHSGDLALLRDSLTRRQTAKIANVTYSSKVLHIDSDILNGTEVRDGMDTAGVLARREVLQVPPTQILAAQSAAATD